MGSGSLGNGLWDFAHLQPITHDLVPFATLCSMRFGSIVISVVDTHHHREFPSYVTLHSNSGVIKGKIFCENGRL
jgi:hypothetical protein